MDVTSNVTKGCGGCQNRPAGSCLSTGTLNGTGSQYGSTQDVISISGDLIRIVTQTDMGELEIMRVSPVQVAEGDSVIITPRHLAITLDLSKFGIRESGVLFRIAKGPQEGRIEVCDIMSTVFCVFLYYVQPCLMMDHADRLLFYL
jgi:hypothetical protein